MFDFIQFKAALNTKKPKVNLINTKWVTFRQVEFFKDMFSIHYLKKGLLAMSLLLNSFIVVRS